MKDPRLRNRLLVDATKLQTLCLDPLDDGMTDEDLKYPDGKALRRFHSVAVPLTAENAAPAVIRQLPSMSNLEEAQAVCLLFMVIGSVIYIPCGAVFACFLLSWTKLLVLVCCTAVATVILDKLVPDNSWPPYRFPSRIRLLLCKYFGFKLIFPPDEVFRNKDNTRQHFIMAGAPHGVVPLGDILGCLTCPLGPINGLGAPAALRAPLWGKLLRQMGLVSCEKESAIRFMNEGQGRSIGVMPGGIAEIFLTNDDTEGAFLLKRKGFCKLAIQAGRPLVPCYTFGNTQVFHCLTGSFLRRLSAILRISVTLFWGRWGLPVPFRKPILLCCGAPIDVVQCDNPTQKQIDALHTTFLEAMQELFDAHKGMYGWPQKRLAFE